MSSLNLLLFGDWGGMSNAPYASVIQLYTRDIMDFIASKHIIAGIISVGDNIYPEGVTNRFDSRFNQTFEHIYNSTHLVNIPWYLIAGDHDWMGNVSAEIEYTHYSQKWNMFNYYYHKTFNIPHTNQTLQIILLDTQFITNSKPFDTLSMATRQHYWLRRVLRTSNATYIVVAGHHPIYSYCHHPPTKRLQSLNNLLLAHVKVIAYVSGHSHNLQFIEKREQMLQYVISGAGKEANTRCHRSRLHNPLNPPYNTSFKYKGKRKGGFVRLEVNKDYARIHFYEGANHSIAYSTGVWFGSNRSYLSVDYIQDTNITFASHFNVTNDSYHIRNVILTNNSVYDGNDLLQLIKMEIFHVLVGITLFVCVFRQFRWIFCVKKKRENMNHGFVGS